MGPRFLRYRSLQVAGALLLGVICLWLSLRQVQLSTLLSEITSFSVPLVLLSTVSVILVSAAKALRWQWLYGSSAPRLSWPAHFDILLISQMLNLAIPIRLGELARLGLMRQEGRPVGVTFGTIVVEKTLDLLAVGLIVLFAIPLALVPQSLRLEAGTMGLLLGVVLFAALLVLGRLERPIANRLARIPEPRSPLMRRIVTWARRAVVAALASMATLRGRQLVRVTALTAVIWLVSLATVQGMLLAFGLKLGWGAPLALMLALTSSNWAPTPPAMIGVVGAVTMAVLAPFGVEATRGLALGTVLNLVLVGPPVLLGGIALWVRLWRLGGTASIDSLRRAAGLGRREESPIAKSGVQGGGHGPV